MEHPISDRQAAQSEDMIAASQAATLWGLFRERVRRCPDATAYRDYDYTKRIWRDHTWCKISERVDRFRAALALANLNPGDRVAILLPNGIDWASERGRHASIVPWVVDGAIGPRSVITITLSGDHRVTDGRAGTLTWQKSANLCRSRPNYERH